MYPRALLASFLYVYLCHQAEEKGPHTCSPCAILLCRCDDAVVDRHRALDRLADWYHHLLLVLLLHHLLIFISHWNLLRGERHHNTIKGCGLISHPSNFHLRKAHVLWIHVSLLSVSVIYKTPTIRSDSTHYHRYQKQTTSQSSVEKYCFKCLSDVLCY